MRNFVDLHTHSYASDGDLAPAEVVRLAESRRLAALALTDHDTVAGLDEAARAAAETKLRFVPGVEISARFKGGTLHIVGLGIDPRSSRLGRVLSDLRAWRRQRNPQMVAKLRSLGIDISMQQLRRFAEAEAGGRPLLGRLHMARLLCRKGAAKSIGDAFDRYLAPGRPAFVEKEKLSARQAIEAIHAAGGVAILAHPPQLNYGNLAQLERLVRSYVHHGLDGMEVYHSDNTPAQTRQYLDLVKRLGLLISGGSDFHGPAKPHTPLGRPRVPLVAVERLLARLPR